MRKDRGATLRNTGPPRWVPCNEFHITRRMLRYLTLSPRNDLFSVGKRTSKVKDDPSTTSPRMAPYHVMSSSYQSLANMEVALP